jgi:itaconyl-CoA hydratase
MSSLSQLTSADNYFEDFQIGRRIRHSRGKTVEALENVLITNLVMNTAHGHFNEHAMKDHPFGQRVSFGGVNCALVMGLASQDCCENGLQELGLDNIQLARPVFHGDTLHAASEVLDVQDSDRPDAGIVRFRHYGFNQRDELCVVGDRSVLIKRRSHWAAA